MATQQLPTLSQAKNLSSTGAAAAELPRAGLLIQGAAGPDNQAAQAACPPGAPGAPYARPRQQWPPLADSAIELPACAPAPSDRASGIVLTR